MRSARIRPASAAICTIGANTPPNGCLLIGLTVTEHDFVSIVICIAFDGRLSAIAVIVCHHTNEGIFGNILDIARNSEAVAEGHVGTRVCCTEFLPERAVRIDLIE